MIEHDKLPRDENGIVQGLWRIVHRSPTYSGGLGFLDMRDGVSSVPAFGRVLISIAAEYGSDVYIEPWDAPVPIGVDVPEFIAHSVAPEIAAAFQPAPWRAQAPAAKSEAPKVQPIAERRTEPPSAPADGLDAMSRDDLVALADLHDVDIDRRWGEAKIRAALRAAGVTE